MKKQNPVHRFATKLYNTPYLITPDAFNVVASYLNSRNSFKLDVMNPSSATGSEDEELPEITPQLGIIEIHGTLTNKPMMSMCGEVGTSYLGILNQMQMIADAGCKLVMLDIDSCGGDAFNCFQTATELRSIADKNGIEIIAYVQSIAASAAYALACIADEIISHPMGMSGSIGVLVALMNDSKQLENEGLARTFITAGANKIPFDASGEFKDSFLSKLQTDVDDLYEQFCSHVSFYTGLSVDDIKATEADTFRAPKALGLGLINSIMTNEEFATYLLTETEE